jgi:hypothetical protein
LIQTDPLPTGAVDFSHYPEILRKVIDAERFPAMLAALDSGAFDATPDNTDVDFRAGVDRILDGIAALVQRSSWLHDAAPDSHQAVSFLETRRVHASSPAIGGVTDGRCTSGFGPVGALMCGSHATHVATCQNLAG